MTDQTADLRAHYRTLFAQHGDNARAVQWADAETQQARFAVLAAMGDPLTSVLDVGCGLGHLCDWLRAQGWRGRYLGVDQVPEFIELANGRLAADPLAEVRLGTATGPLPGGCDYALLSGVFNNTMPDNESFMRDTLRAMWAAARIGIAFNAMSRFVDWQDPGLWYTDPAVVLEFCKTELCGHPVLIHDYVTREHGYPYEFAVHLRKVPRFWGLAKAD